MNLLEYANEKLEKAIRNGEMDDAAYWRGYRDCASRVEMTPQSAVNILHSANLAGPLRTAADMGAEALKLIDADELLKLVDPDEYYHSNEVRDMIDLVPTIEFPPNASRTLEELREIVKQLEWCGYECEGGPLSMNKAFIRLEELAYRRKPEEGTR